MTGTALFVGDVSWDTTVLAPRMPEADEKVLASLCADSAGGVTANSAVACFRAGADVAFYSTVGADVAGEAVTADLARQGLAVTLETTPGATARAVILLDADGEKRLFLYQGDRMYPSATTTATLPLDDVRWMHTALYDAESASVLIARCRDASVPWSIDLEPATIPDDLAALAGHIDGCEAVIVNVRAVEAIGPRAVERLHELGAVSVIETLGPDGARSSSRSGDVVEVRPPDFADPVRDTTGAGDAFAGWFIAERLRGTANHVALQRAVEAASFSVRRIGAIASYPYPADLRGEAAASPLIERQQ